MTRRLGRLGQVLVLSCTVAARRRRTSAAAVVRLSAGDADSRSEYSRGVRR